MVLFLQNTAPEKSYQIGQGPMGSNVVAQLSSIHPLKSSEENVSKFNGPYTITSFGKMIFAVESKKYFTLDFVKIKFLRNFAILFVGFYQRIAKKNLVKRLVSRHRI